MPGLLYYLPGGDCSVTLQTAREAGIGYAFEAKPTARGVHGGPDDGRGVVLADSTRIDLGDIGYHPNRQTWRQVDGTEAWVGRYIDKPVRPEDLQRTTMLDGHLVELADGQQWLCPIARGYLEEEGELRYYCNLPRGLIKDGDGRWTPGDVRSGFAHLWDLAERWQTAYWASLAGDDVNDEKQGIRVTFDYQDLANGAIQALQVNYRIGDAEVQLLGLFEARRYLSDTVMAEVLHALVDLPAQVAHWKKKLTADSPPDDSPIDDGLPASIEATDPPSPT